MKKAQLVKSSSKKIPKVPLVMQLEALECGAACLCMILGYFNKWIPLEQCRIDCGVSRDGSSASNMRIAAKNYGLKTKVYKLEIDELKEFASFPCIIHWNLNHFVVLKGIKGNYAYINDPAAGNVKVPMEEFDKSFTGICMVFEPGENFVESGKKPSSIDYIKAKIRGLGPMMVFGIVLTVFAYLAELLEPAFNRVFYDNILTKTNPDWATPFIIAFAVFAVLELAISFLNTIFNYRAAGKFDIIGSSSFLWKVLRLPIRFFSQRMTGDIVQRKEANSTISTQIVNTIAPLFIQAIMMILYLIIMVNFSWPLALVAVATSIINLVCSRLITKKRMNSMRIVLRDNAKAQATQTSGIEIIETIKASGAEDGYFAKWAGYQANALEGQAKYTKVSVYYGLIPQLMSSLCTASILAIGLYLTMKGEFTLGMITAFQGYLTSFMSPVQTLISAGQSIQEMQTSIERVNDVMNYPIDSIFNEENQKEPESYQKLSGNISIKNVSFGYSPLRGPLIKDFSLEIKQGDSVAIVGSSGSGKSTISKLVSGIEKPWSGEILFDGKSVEQINRSIFTGSLAVVDQDVIVFEDSIRNNIKMYDDTIEDFEMIMAAMDAQLHEDIMIREDGYDYILCSGGKDFSGGQRQRLEIARVLAQDPSICILDEATSALDAKTEFEVVKAIKNRGITTIVIAHRLSTVRDCDKIIVLDRGNVVEVGTHEELMAKDGYYASLIKAD